MKAPSRSHAVFAAAAVLGGGLALAGVAAPANAASPVTTTYSTPGVDVFVVPVGITSIHVQTLGGSGGGSFGTQVGGAGVLLTEDLAVTPGDTYFVHVAGNGHAATATSNGAGFNGGGGAPDLGGAGGGGASDVRLATDTLGARVIVAGGGGGGGGGAYGSGAGGSSVFGAGSSNTASSIDTIGTAPFVTISYDVTDATTVTVTASKATITADGSSTSIITAHATDTALTPVPGDTIVFSSTDAAQTFGPVTDNGDGIYTTVLTSSTTVHTTTITATDTTAPSDPSGTVGIAQTAILAATGVDPSPTLGLAGTFDSRRCWRASPASQDRLDPGA
jgi:hypothetical protein